MHLYNGDKCVIGQHIIARRPEENHPNPTFIARVEEIIQQIGSPAQIKGQPDGILLQTINCSGLNNKYQMPHLLLTNERSFVQPQVKFHTFFWIRNTRLKSCFGLGYHVYHQRSAQLLPKSMWDHRFLIHISRARSDPNKIQHC